MNKDGVSKWTKCVLMYFQSKVSIIDFNPFGTTTDGLLFTWEELFDFDVNPDASLVSFPVDSCAFSLHKFIKISLNVSLNYYVRYADVLLYPYVVI